MEKKPYTPNEQFVHKRVFHVLSALKKLRILNNSSYYDFYKLMRTIFVPGDAEDFYGNKDALDGVSYRSHSPEPQALVRKGTGYFMSYLYSPNEKFFRTTTPDFKTQKKQKSQLDRTQFLQDLTGDIHAIYQEHSNFAVQNLVLRDKLIFGHGMKVIERSETLISEYKHILPEQTILGSTTGVLNDIFGYVEEKDHFNARLTLGEELFTKENFSKPIVDFADELILGNDRDDTYTVSSEHEDGALSKGLTEYARFNVPYKAFKILCLSGKDWYDKDERDKKNITKIFDELFYEPEIKDLTTQETGFIDIWCSDNQVFKPVVKRLPNIVYSGFLLGKKITSITTGFGKETQGLMLAFAEIFLQNVDAYQRMNLPPYVLYGEDQDYQANVGPNGIIFSKSEDNPTPTVLSYPGNLDGMIKFWQELIRQMKEAWHINDFELIKQTHMTIDEVGKRSTDGYRSLTSYTTVDSLTDLKPTTLNNANNLYFQSDNKRMFKGLILDVRFQSPLTYAHKNSFINSVDLLLDMFQKYSGAKQMFPDAMMSFDDDKMANELVESLGIADILRNDEELKAAMQQRAAEKNFQDKLALVKAQQGGSSVAPFQNQGGGGQGGGKGVSTKPAGKSENRGGQTSKNLAV